MELSKDKMKENLIEIRTVISIIDSINDEKINFENMIDTMNKEEEHTEENIRKTRVKNKELSEKIQNWEIEKHANERELQENKRKKKICKILFIAFLLLAIGLTIFLLYDLYKEIVGDWKVDKNDKFMKQWGWLIGLFLIGLDILLIIGTINMKASHSMLGYEISKKIKTNDELNKMITGGKSSFKSNESILERLSTNLPIMIEENKIKREEYVNCIKNNIIVMDNLYKNLVDRFQNFLDPSDWKDVDILYYYLSTNRTDTIKESLHMLEHKKNTDSIISEIKGARDAICLKIEESTRRLESSLDYVNKAIHSLRDTMNESNTRIIRSISGLSQSLDYSNDLVAKQIELADINKSLLEKSNKSMDEMITSYKHVNRSHYLIS